MDVATFASSSLTIACVSDTHNDDCSQSIPAGDIFVHAGDMTDFGTEDELQRAFDWISSLPHRVKVIVAGNHDMGLDPRHPKFSQKSLDLFQSPKAKERGVHYLDRAAQMIAQFQDPSGTHTIPIRAYGNPCQPDFLKSSYAFTYLPHPDPSAEAAWKTAPTSATQADAAELWIMHSPPKGHLDAIPIPPLTGCAVQFARIKTAKPKLCVFGHYHSSYGAERALWGPDDEKDEFVRVDDLKIQIGGQGQEKGNEATLLVNAAWMTLQGKKTDKRNSVRVVEWIL